MAESQYLTSTDHIILDNQLSEVSNKDSLRRMPFNDTLDELILKIKINSKDTIEEEYINSDFPPYIISRGVNHYKKYSKIVQNWLGHVTKTTKTSFYADLIDLVSMGTYETGEFDISSVSPDDRKLIKIGAAFYWNISERMSNGQISKESIIRFQRLVDWEETNFDNATDRATMLLEKLKFK